jgi:eukaryotic-like serine/threonine-protein kinase
MDDRRSERFGRYEILSELGRGAMGVVYKARDPKINRVVAVKTVSLAGQPPEEEHEYRERFIREAEAAGRLSHPGIVTIFDVGEEPETRAPYIVMEYVGGQSLDKLLARAGSKLKVETALQITLELAEALDCAHGQGVVHRDLKPANILMTDDGHAKIADFGVAKLNLANQTLAGRALGTPAYMSPEQLNGETVDGRSDLFSLGVVLYTLLTGHRPFQGNSAITVSFKVVNRDFIPATLLDTELPPGLDYIIARAMAKEPAERYQRGMEMVFDIQELRAGREPWSKAKLQGSPSNRIGAKAAGDRGGLLGNPWIAAKLIQSARTLKFEQGFADNFVKNVRKNSLIGGLVCVGLLLVALAAISFHTPKTPPRTAGPVPRLAEVSPVTSAAQTPTERILAAIDSGASASPSNPATTTNTPGTTPDLTGSQKSALTYQLDPSPLKSHAAKASYAKSSMVKRAALKPSDAKSNETSDATPAVAKISRANAPAISPATLVIEVDHKFAEARLSIWVDDRLTYEHELEGTPKKHLVLFHQVQAHESHAMQLPPGKHHLRARVTSNESGYDRFATVEGEFVSGQENVLHINCNKSSDLDLTLQ